MSREIPWRHTGRARSSLRSVASTFVSASRRSGPFRFRLSQKPDLRHATCPGPEGLTFQNDASLVTGRPQYFQSGRQQVDTGATPAQFFTRWFFNILLVTLGSTVISIVVLTLAAYSLTRFRYWGRTFVPYFSLLGYMSRPSSSYSRCS